MGLRDGFAPLGIRAFRMFWTGQLVSSVGDGMVPVVTAFAVLGAGGGAGGLGAVLAVGMVCRVLAALVGGVLADRISRRHQMAAADAVRCAVQLGLGLLITTGHESAGVLAVGNGLYGIAAGFYGPASAGLVPALVERPMLQRAAALQSLTRSGAMIVGPAAAGLLIPFTAPQVVYFIDAASFAVNVTVLLRLVGVAVRARTGRTFLADLVRGWHEVSARRWLLLNLLAHAAWNFGMATFFVLGPVLAQRQLGGSAAWGLVAAGMSAGSLAASTLAMRWQPSRPLVAGNLALTLAALPLLALLARLPAPVVALAAAASNGGVVLLNAVWDATLQRVIPEEVLSRVSSYDTLFSLVSMPLGYALVGPAAHHLGDSGTLWTAISCSVLPCSLICLLPAVRGVGRAEPETPLEEGAAEPAAAC
ncbi:MFS transporter [Kitasatospora saccharophila]|uniref:MFS transporter n=1 Tax=Kitasatospora saccharophila TaxID=407973 RepID=A0ABN2X394_9ACTN